MPVKNFRLGMLESGTKLLWLSGAAVIPEIVFLVVYARLTGTVHLILTALFALVFDFIIFMTGFIKTAVGSKQVKPLSYIPLLLLWWFPVVNLVLIRKFYKAARRELIFELDREELESARSESEICRTKYPIVMVHGIFFRDWQLMNYWGRIPAALIRNGATIFYGGQQSALSIPDSAAELKEKILGIIAETGAEKVNIIAHSKGGLDSRYAISALGLDKYVATLTTVNTPHNGCDMVDYLLAKIPDRIVHWVTKKYNTVFHKLGDKAPDFFAGINDLRPASIASLEAEMTDSPDVSYRSCMSIMKNASSAGFPLNMGYRIIKKLNGENDGLVWDRSAEHGSFRMIKPPGKRGISHGDMIDLFRENIDGFDVREFYTGIAAELKNQGY
ncbi:MAG: hypothetical protein NC093_01420 [Alistipes sp.]|nr:hypothetical protein [Alistipes sp.]